MDRDYIDLLALQHSLRLGVEEIFPGRLWVKAEVSSIQVKSNGHCYIDLVQSGDGTALARAKAVVWRSRYVQLAPKFEDASGGLLTPGTEVLLLVRASYSELYGLTLTVEDVEPRFSLGAAELLRRRTIERLGAEGLMDRQKSLGLALVPRRLAVISAEGSAGYGDFMRHLTENEFGFAFDVRFFGATMQGAEAPSSMAEAVSCAESGDDWTPDAILLIRGGGSAFDLACFDDYGLCLAIATCGIPVFTAIGHDKDYHVADMVAYDFVKTPTALADRFIDALASEDERITSVGTTLRLALRSRVATVLLDHSRVVEALRRAFDRRLSEMTSRLDLLDSRVRSADPRSVLSRGYVLVSDSRGVLLKSAGKVAVGDKIEITFGDGSIVASVEKKNKT